MKIGVSHVFLYIKLCARELLSRVNVVDVEMLQTALASIQNGF